MGPGRAQWSIVEQFGPAAGYFPNVCHNDLLDLSFSGPASKSLDSVLCRVLSLLVTVARLV